MYEEITEHGPQYGVDVKGEIRKAQSQIADALQTMHDATELVPVRIHFCGIHHECTSSVSIEVRMPDSDGSPVVYRQLD